MSINEIINYVKKTPGNTNPSVIKSMINSEVNETLEEAKKMDEETLAMANAYTDSQRLGYVETQRTYIIRKGSLEFIQEVNGLAVYSITDASMPVAGEKYTVVYNGAEYICAAAKITDPYDENEGYFIGNGSLGGSDYENTGEPFVITIGIQDGQFIAGMVEQEKTDGGIDTEVYLETTTIHKIDPKFIPAVLGSGIPTVDYALSPFKELKDGDVNQMSSAISAHKPFCDAVTAAVKQSPSGFFFKYHDPDLNVNCTVLVMDSTLDGMVVYCATDFYGRKVLVAGGDFTDDSGQEVSGWTVMLTSEPMETMSP